LTTGQCVNVSGDHLYVREKIIIYLEGKVKGLYNCLVLKNHSQNLFIVLSKVNIVFNS